jgi:hypothetical protein
MSEWTKKILRIFPSAEARCIVPVPEAAAEMQAIMQNLRTLDAVARIPHFQLVDHTSNLGGGFFNFCNGVLVFNQSVWESDLRPSLEYSGSIHSTILRDTGEEIHFLNVTGMENCLNFAETVYRTPAGGEEKGGNHNLGVIKPAFYPKNIGKNVFHVYQIPGEIFAASDGAEGDDFYFEYQKSHFRGLQFEELWSLSDEHNQP